MVNIKRQTPNSKYKAPPWLQIPAHSHTCTHTTTRADPHQPPVQLERSTANAREPQNQRVLIDRKWKLITLQANKKRHSCYFGAQLQCRLKSPHLSAKCASDLKKTYLGDHWTAQAAYPAAGTGGSRRSGACKTARSAPTVPLSPSGTAPSYQMPSRCRLSIRERALGTVAQHCLRPKLPAIRCRLLP
jgi:hypothetical protein